jgi:hypothetical protein
LIFGAIEALLASRQPVDVLTVFAALRDQQHEVSDFGGLPYLGALPNSIPSIRNVRRYAELVAEKAVERALIAGLDEASTLSWDSTIPLEDRMERVASIVHRVEQFHKAPGARRVPVLRLEELQKASAAVRWLVKRVIPADSVGMLFGGSGTFKSFIALDMALHVTHGLPWMGRKTLEGPVLYIAAEGGAGLWPRIDAWHRARGLFWKSTPLYVVPAAIDLQADAWRVVDAAQLVNVKPVLVVVDTLSQTYAGEENSANEMAAYLRELGARFRQLWACSVLLVHHSGHSATERPRGSSAIRANIDYLLGVYRDEKEMLATVSCVKQKDGELFDDATFSMSVAPLGEDEDGDKLTSLVARHLGTAEDVGEAIEAEGKAGRGGKNQLLLRLLQSGQRLSELRKVFYDECDLADADARRQAFFRALKWAKERGFMEVSEGIVIVTKVGA